MLTAFLVVELRRKEPLVQLRLLLRLTPPLISCET
jgi:hypothetical protein